MCLHMHSQGTVSIVRFTQIRDHNDPDMMHTNGIALSVDLVTPSDT